MASGPGCIVSGTGRGTETDVVLFNSESISFCVGIRFNVSSTRLPCSLLGRIPTFVSKRIVELASLIRHMRLVMYLFVAGELQEQKRRGTKKG